MTYQICKANEDYEILNEYPFTVRRINDQRTATEGVNSNGYVYVYFGGRQYLKHRLIMEQFNPVENMHLLQVDHINHDRTDYHLSNLRWVTASENCRNRTSVHGVDYTYLAEIPDDAIEVDEYGNHTFEFYFYSESTNQFYYYNGATYRILHVNVMKASGALYVKAIDTNNKPIKIYLNKFKKIYDIPF